MAGTFTNVEEARLLADVVNAGGGVYRYLLSGSGDFNAADEGSVVVDYSPVRQATGWSGV